MSLVLSDITLRAGDQRLLDQVGLTTRPGSRVAVLGPNGAGKSSLLSCIAGERVYQGRITAAGEDTGAWSPAQRARRMAVMPQSLQVTFPVRVWEVVAMGRYPWGDEDSTRQWQQAAMLESDVWHLRDRDYQSLSGGEQQRVQLARVLVQLWQQRQEGGDGCYLLLDECTSSLDPAHQHAVLASARCFAASGVTVLAVMHDTALAASWADHVVLMKQGRIVREGEASLLCDAEVLEQTFDLPPAVAGRYACQNGVWLPGPADKA